MRIQTWWKQREPINFSLVKKPFYIFRHGQPTLYDAAVLAAYVRSSRDVRDVMCRVAYSTPELCGLSVTSGDVRLRTFLSRPPSPREELRTDIVLRRALEEYVLEAALRVAMSSGSDAAFLELVGSVQDLLALTDRAHVDTVLQQTQNTMQRRSRETDAPLGADFAATYHALCALRTQMLMTRVRVIHRVHPPVPPPPPPEPPLHPPLVSQPVLPVLPPRSVLSEIAVALPRLIRAQNAQNRQDPT